MWVDQLIGDVSTPYPHLRKSAFICGWSLFRVNSGAFAVAIVLLIANMMAGCAGHSTQRTEDLLSAAGFNVVIASTPQQLQHLATLPPYKLIKIQRKGKVRYVYADPAQKLIYAGGVFAYQRFKDLRLTKNLAEQDIQDAEFNAQRAAEWDVWGPF